MRHGICSVLVAGAFALGSLFVIAPTTATSEASVSHCVAPADLTRLDLPLRRTARRLASRKLTMIVALGSSSPAGAGASSAETTYPSRLMLENGVSYGTVHSVRVGLAPVEVGILARPEGEIRSLLATYQCARSTASMVANPEIIEPALATTADMP
jgi:hypothetical protein